MRLPRWSMLQDKWQVADITKPAAALCLIRYSPLPVPQACQTAVFSCHALSLQILDWQYVAAADAFQLLIDYRSQQGRRVSQVFQPSSLNGHTIQLTRPLQQTHQLSMKKSMLWLGVNTSHIVLFSQTRSFKTKTARGLKQCTAMLRAETRPIQLSDQHTGIIYK